MEPIEQVLFRLLHDRLRLICDFPSLPLEQEYRWTLKDNQWHGEAVLVPNLLFTILPALDLKKSDSDVDALRSAYPLLDQLVGCPSCHWMKLEVDRILQKSLYEIFRRHKRWDIDEGTLLQFCRELSNALSQDKAKLIFRAVLLGMQLDSTDQRIELSDNLWLYRFTDDEVSALYERGRSTNAGPRMYGHFDRWGLCTSEVEPIGVYSGKATGDGSARNRLKNALTSFRTFKDGRINLGAVECTTDSFIPQLESGSASFDGEILYLGQLKLETAELNALKSHIRLLSPDVHPAIQAASRRLSSSSTRYDNSDSILDAVVGMESILLHETGSEKYRGELKFRFATNFAFLKPKNDERRLAYRLARWMYDLRSTIAHGGVPSEKDLRFDGSNMSLADAAAKCREALRELVHLFGREAHSPGFTNPKFWEDQMFST